MLLAGYDYTFSKRNQLNAIDFLPSQYDSEDVDYSYDFVGQLKTADQNGTTNDESYTYDSNGNRVVANGSNYTTGGNNQLHSVRDPSTGKPMDFKFTKHSTEGRGIWESTPDLVVPSR